MSNLPSGLTFPFRINARGGVKTTSGAAKVAQNLRHLLSTRLGERVMLRGYGCGVRRRVHDPNDAALRNLIRHEIEEALRAYLPELRLIAPIRISTEEQVLSVVLEYTLSPLDAAQRTVVQIP